MTLAFQVLRVAAAMCFIGHGAFGLLTKAGWVPYFAVVGIGNDLAYFFMPIVGIVDILVGLSVLVRPTRAAFAYMTVWALWTALLRPLSGQGWAEFLERAGNYGVPLAVVLLGLATLPRAGWFGSMAPRAADDTTTRRIAWVLRATTATLLLGHGVLAVTGKPLLVKHLAAIGIAGGGGSTGPAIVQGAFEIGLAFVILAFPWWPVVLLACAWKVATELIFPLSGDYVWEFIERGGSYGAPLALALLARHRASAG